MRTDRMTFNDQRRQADGVLPQRADSVIYLILHCNVATGEHKAWGFRSSELRDAALAQYPPWRFCRIQKIDAAWVADDPSIANYEQADLNNTAQQYPKEGTA